MKSKKLFLLLILFYLMSLGLSATNGMRMIGFGPVQRSMGGASVGMPLDAASVLTNPAGMEYLDPRIDFGATYFSPSVSAEFAGTDYDSDKQASPVPAFGMIIALTEEINFGLGAYGVSGMGVDYKIDAYDMILNTSYSQMRFAPGLSYKLNDEISLGATINVMYATMEYSMNDGIGNQYFNMGASSFGYGATLGLIYKPTDILSIGLTYETTSYFQDFEFNQYINQTNPSDDVLITENSLSFNQPMNAALGFGYSPMKELVLALDIQWIKWSETNGDDLPEFTGGDFDMQWEDQIVYKLGVQYSVNQQIDLRAGFNYGKMPLSSDALQANMFFPAVSEMHYTFGAGYSFNENLAINLSYMYSPEATVDSYNGESSMSQYSLDLSVAYKF